GFDALPTADFNANSPVLIPYKHGVAKQSLPRILTALRDDFYDSTAVGSVSADRPPTHLPEAAEGVPVHHQFQCPHCLSIYDPAYGDELAAVPPGRSEERRVGKE